MNYQDKLKQEKVDFDPQAWQAFQTLRNERANGGASISSKTEAEAEADKRKRIILLLFLVGLAIALGWLAHLYGTHQNDLPISQQELTQSVESVATPSREQPSTTSVAKGAGTNLTKDNTQDPVPMAPLSASEISAGKTAQAFKSNNRPSSITSMQPLTARATSGKPPVFSPSEHPIVNPASTSTVRSASTASFAVPLKNITKQEEAIRSSTVAAITALLPAASLDLLEEKPLKDDLPTLNYPKIKRPGRFILQANLGWGHTNWSNPFQSNFGFSRSKISGPYGQLRILYPINRLVSVGIATGYYQGEDQVVHRDNLKETDQRISLLGQVELQLIRHQRLALGLTLGGGLEHSNYRFASLTVDNNGNAIRLLDPIKESNMTFQLQLNATYRFNTQTTLGAFANAFSSNDGFYGYGLICQRKF